MSADIVFLIPGFLGFERAGNFGNFADRVCSALRTQLEGRLDASIRVVPLASLPTSTFAERQRALLQALAHHVAADASLERIHLVGHSVGGVDAHLLACEEPLNGAFWAEIDPFDLRLRLRSVVSIASPHGGMCLAAAPGAGSLSLSAIVGDPTGVKEMVDLVNKMLRSALSDVGTGPRAAGLLREYRKVKHFMAELMRWQGFLRFLTPDAMELLYARSEPRDDVVRRSFVTMAGRPRDPAQPSSRVDAFFQEISRRSAGDGNGFTRHGMNVRDAASVLRAAVEDPQRVIVSSEALPPAHIDAQTNDGVVNSVRQLMVPSDPDELVAIVIADHFDVLGYYDRGLAVVGPGSDDVAVSGLLHSGSAFRDTEFFALYRRMGDVIAQQCLANTSLAAPRSVSEVAPPKRPKRAPSRRPSP